jgi:D-galactose 1-dehydrogenase
VTGQPEKTRLAQRKSWRCGIVGLGRIGRLYADLIENEPLLAKRFSLVAGADSKPAAFSSEAFAVSADYRDLLKADLDAVLIATPPSSHYEITRAALLAGRHVLVEKPPAATAADAAALIDLGRSQNRVLFFAFHARYNWAVQRAKKELQEDVIRRVDATYKEYVFHYHARDSWVLREGVLRDSGINVLSIVTDVLPPGARLNVTNTSLGESLDLQSVTKARVEFSFGNGGSGVLDIDWTHKGAEVRDVSLYTGAVMYRIDIVSDTLERDGVPLEREKGGGGLSGEYARMLADFASHLDTRSSLVSTAELEFIEAAHHHAPQ